MSSVAFSGDLQVLEGLHSQEVLITFKKQAFIRGGVWL